MLSVQSELEQQEGRQIASAALLVDISFCRLYVLPVFFILLLYVLLL